MEKSLLEKEKKLDLFSVINVTILCIFALLIIYPFYNSVLVSLVPQQVYVKTPFMLFPSEINFNSYKFVFRSSAIMNGFAVTIFVLVAGTLYSMFLSLTSAYALSKTGYPGRKLIISLIIFTMYFGGGLIPFYLTVRGVGLRNNILAMVIPAGINTFYMLIMMNFFRSLPVSLEESAKIDGANEITVLFRIMLPISTPVLATFILFYAVDRWNEYWLGMLFIDSARKRPLQLVLRSMLTAIEMPADSGGAASSLSRNIFQDGVKMAIITVTMFPIMCVYPFLQKYFMKGIMIGAIKT